MTLTMNMLTCLNKEKITENVGKEEKNHEWSWETEST